MKRYFLLIFTLFFVLLIACKKQTYRINGTVENEIFWGEKVYLVALDAPITKNVDSTVIKNGSFHFRGEADSMEVRILRFAPKFPDFVEDLVVVLEPGTINAQLGVISSGHGTRLNYKLHEWKINKARYDSIQWNISRLKKSGNITQGKKDSLTNHAKELSDIFLSENLYTINKNIHNGIGLLLFKLYYHAIPAEERNKILDKVGNIYFERDAQLRQQVQQ
ncbi:MAG: DUF4369 domain-containing protein [Bacteroidetes bacterium]|nr:DUF4369 domain-containing protein [Bacteroidota bacterium]